MRGFYHYLNAIAMRIDKRMLHRKKSQGHFIAMFHDIVKDATSADKDEFSITEENLKEFLVKCWEQNYEIVSLDYLMRNGLDGRKKCVITFDDGFESLYTIAKPIFEAENIPYTIFLTTSFLGKKGYLTEKMVQELAESKLCTVAMHADQHLMYRYETDDVLRHNYMVCEKRIQELTNHKPLYFAFPYGSFYACSKHNCHVVKEMGARAVFVTRQRMLDESDLKNSWYIPRLNVPGYFNNTVEKEDRGFDI